MGKPLSGPGPGRPKKGKTARQKRTDPKRSARAKQRIKEHPQSAPPAKHDHLFQPGVSPNPGGRKTTFETKLSRAIERKLEEMMPNEQYTVAEALAEKLVRFVLGAQKLDRALVSAIQELGDRSEGKPTQKVVTESSDPFAGRSYEELIYFAENGHWPEEAKGVARA